MKLILSLFFLLILSQTKAQELEREIRISPIFEWVDEKEERTIHSFEGGGNEYSYNVLVNRKPVAIDSVVVWVDGKREFLPGKKLDEMGKGSFDIKERADTVWFYFNKKRTEFYYHPTWQYMIKGFPLFFIEKSHLMLRSGVVNMPFDTDEYVCTVNRNFATCTDNEQWQKTIQQWSDLYKGVVFTQDDHRAVLNLYGKETSYRKSILNAVASSASVASISISLTDIVRNNTTFFIQSDLSIYTEADAKKVEELAVKYGFSKQIDRSGGIRYNLIYTKSKILDLDYIRNCQKLIQDLGVINATNQFYSEVRLD
jgi:hypothetical protein